MMRNLSYLCLGMVCASTFVGGGCSRKELEPTPPEQTRPAALMRPAPDFRPVKGAEDAAQEAGLVSQALPALRSHLEIRTILVRAGQPVSLPSEYEAVLELRAGSVATITDGNRQQRQRGEMWQVDQRSHIMLQAFGELAVVRAVYVVPNNK